MKSFKFNIFLLSAVFTLNTTSCSSWLEEDPKTFISPSSFYQTVEDFEGALKGLYPQDLELRLSEIFADYNDKPESAEQVGDIWANNPGDGFWAFRETWTGLYSTIKNANMILESIEDKDFSEDVKNNIIAEAKCIRAWSYFYLVQFWGDVPMRTSVVTEQAQIAIDRTSEKEIYHLIFDDMTFAEQNLPEKSVMGRVNKYVAKALMARIYLTSAGFPMNIKENYGKAKEKALEVINSKVYYLMPSFDKVFKTERYTAETIWARLFEKSKSHSSMHLISVPIESQTATCLPTQAFIESFDKGDMRKEWGIKPNYVNAKGNMFVKRSYYNKFVNEEYLEQEMPASNTSILTYQTQLIRLAEMYLIVAEAENEMNGPTNIAYQYINEIRKRARVNADDSTNVPDLKGLSKEQFREAVYLERKHELFEEGFAWFDLKRTQTFNKVQEARGDKLNVPVGPYNNTWLIPDFEILNNNIPQNPDYR